MTLLARDGAAAGEITRTARIRAAGAGVELNFTAEPLPGAAEVLARLRPDVLVCCASAQSPYERLAAPSPWTRLIAEAGFGLTLPLQASVVVRLARAVAQVSPETLVVNAAFPDAVNPLLTGLGLPVTCGVGNVATLAACLQAALGLPDQHGLAVLGHHAQLGTPAHPDDEVRAWRDGRPLRGVTELLAGDRALARSDLNAIGGHAAARLLVDLLTGVEVRTSLPGPLGLPGGYPVRLTGGTVSLDLPPGLSRADAIGWNLRVGRRDGVQVQDGEVSYPPVAADALAAHLPDLAAGWPIAALDEVTDRFIALRQRLRLAPPRPVVPAALA